ncbi:ubiquitin-conjugating enzyme/RWD-like protein [Russula ochroleuca]|uniref:E2 ubiquitin-conjugating enzyme n=1 Tax=Russula ochroleuca TaxID=152965 RepID=A0A9P5N6E3_9AGAM|nr:ubiquitin-conjugating enzyme/RWD-like protein [Russula ochroleuca]
MRRLIRELKDLRLNPPEGIRVQLSEESLLDVVGIIEGPEGTPYQGGYFRVKFEFNDEFPATPPRCWFATKIFHPNVSNTGEICVNTLKKDWKPSFGIGHILVTIKCLLIYPNPDSALDEEAGKLLQENYESYCERAKLITSKFPCTQVPPPEFETQSAPADTQNAPAPIAASLPSASPLPSMSPPPLLSPQKGIMATMTTTTIPLQQSASNTFSVSSSLSSLTNATGEREKDRHVSPSPLGTADSNVSLTHNRGATLSPAKAVKRGAAPGGGAGEKRKKALKRL